jgi:hypothetical protein
MRIIRLLLQLIFGLLSAVIVLIFLAKPNPNYVSDLSMLAFLILIIIVLGPCWPSQENLDRWSEKWKFDLPTDNPQAALYVFNVLGAIYGFYKAWNAYAIPIQAKDLWRIEKTAFTVAGVNGVIAFWLLLALACLLYGVAAYVKSRKA